LYLFIYYFLCRIPCRSGMCSTPIHVTSSQLIASEIFPVPVVKALLYPGAVVNGLVRNMTVPSWDKLLNIYNLTSAKEAPAVTDLQRLEVLLFNFSYLFFFFELYKRRETRYFFFLALGYVLSNKSCRPINLAEILSTCSLYIIVFLLGD